MSSANRELRNQVKDLRRQLYKEIQRLKDYQVQVQDYVDHLQLQRDIMLNRYNRANDTMRDFVPKVRQRASELLQHVKKIQEDAAASPNVPAFISEFLVSCRLILDAMAFGARA